MPFETKVGMELAEFVSRARRAGPFLAAYAGDGAVGSVIIDASDGGSRGAHLRWFIVAEEMQGKAVSAQLIGRAIDILRPARQEHIWLTTFAGLDAARSSSERNGFVLGDEAEIDQWSGYVREQVLSARRRSPPAADDGGSAAQRTEKTDFPWWLVAAAPRSRQRPASPSPTTSTRRSSASSSRASASRSWCTIVAFAMASAARAASIALMALSRSTSLQPVGAASMSRSSAASRSCVLLFWIAFAGVPAFVASVERRHRTAAGRRARSANDGTRRLAAVARDHGADRSPIPPSSPRSFAPASSRSRPARSRPPRRSA